MLVGATKPSVLVTNDDVLEIVRVFNALEEIVEAEPIPFKLTDVIVAAAVPLPAFRSLMVTAPPAIPAIGALPTDVVAVVTNGKKGALEVETTGAATTVFAAAAVAVTVLPLTTPVEKPVNVPVYEPRPAPAPTEAPVVAPELKLANAAASWAALAVPVEDTVNVKPATVID